MAKDRMYEGRLNYLVVTLAALAASLPLFALGLAVEWEIGLTLSLVGLLLAFVLPILFELRANRSRSRRVVFLDYRRHQFGTSLARGVEDTLRESDRPWTFEYVRPSGTGSEGAIRFQVEQLKEASTESVDAVVLLPETDEDALWQAALRCMNAGIAVVVADVPPRSSVFEMNGLGPPYFVASDYARGGHLVASLILDHLQASPEARALLLAGPHGSWPGEERSRQMVLDILLAGSIDQISFILLDDWNVTEQRCERALAELSEFPGASWIVYCADDEHAIALHSLLQNRAPDLRKRCALIGYDATGNEFDLLPVFEFGAVEWTIDVDPEEQGREIGRHLLALRLGHDHPRTASALVQPRVISRGDYSLQHR